MWKHLFTANFALALATPQLYRRDPVQCPIIFDGRVSQNSTPVSFNIADVSPYSTQYVKGENLTWSQIIFLPNTTTSRFDTLGVHRSLEVTINDHSLFRSGQRLQYGFRRAGLLLKDDKNAAGADAADQGVVTFHWSVRQDVSKPMNLSHEYMNVWHEKADYSGNQFTFVGGVVLPVDAAPAIDAPEEKNAWRIQNAKNEFLFRTPIRNDAWQNFAVQLDYTNK
ncbi:glycoside hydrolase family 131 protein [Karstenula rhodostoma CBS 690.94]|uniref:Glycoside hydrolase family 131 protein n=1 Tax=Karstenula rhodostoma CBS 690.94 TaxID=1392251 RepID=A0A9P4PI02_9PLEO|nr:glycoside hydrolase family 131 protein [Karstenula rhodostoma CBS 690.94]